MNREEIAKKIITMSKELAELKAKLDTPEFKEGDWVYAKRDDDIAIMNINNDWGGFGLYNGEWLEGKNTSISYFRNAGYDVLRKATKSEIESALIKEAERRGYEKYNFTDAFDGIHTTDVPRRGFEYQDEVDGLLFGNRYVYFEGKWAEMIKDEKFFEWDVEEDGDITIGCRTFKKEFLRNLNDCLYEVRQYSVEEVLTELKKLNL